MQAIAEQRQRIAREEKEREMLVNSNQDAEEEDGDEVDAVDDAEGGANSRWWTRMFGSNKSAPTNGAKVVSAEAAGTASEVIVETAAMSHASVTEPLSNEPSIGTTLCAPEKVIEEGSVTAIDQDLGTENNVGDNQENRRPSIGPGSSSPYIA